MQVAIIGGGLAGLVAAYDLASTGAAITLLDDRAELGGQVRTRRDQGFVIDDGAEGFVADDPSINELCTRLGLADQVRYQAARRSLVLSGGTLSELSPRRAAALIGIPVPDPGESRGIASLRNGMATLVERLASQIGRAVKVHQAARVVALTPAKSRWRLSLAGGPSVEADAVIVAVPPTAAAALLAPLDRQAADLLAGIPLHSNVSVSLAYPAGAVAHGLDASGFVVAGPDSSSTGLRACAFSSSKFPDRAPSGAVLIRAFFRPPPGVTDPDQAWVERAVRAVGSPLGLSGPPLGSWVAQWPAAIPEIQSGHGRLMEDLEPRVRALGAVQLAGAAYLPGGVPGAVRSGVQAVRNLVAYPLPA